MLCINIIKEYLINNITSENINILTSSILVFAVLILKTFIKNASKGSALKNFLYSLVEIPMDIIILAISFTVTYTCTQENVNVGITILISEFGVAILSFGLCYGTTKKILVRGKRFLDYFFITIGIFISFFTTVVAYILAISLLLGGQ